MTSSKGAFTLPSSRTTKIKSVSFSMYSELRFVPYPSRQEIRKRWYNKEDQKGFQDQTIYEAMQFSAMLSRNPIMKGQDEKNRRIARSCIGLEHLIAKDVIQHMKASMTAKKRHIMTVLEEQDRQRKCNARSNVNLARVSHTSSKSARERSHAVAMMVKSVV
jgi:hypothetical protein